MVVGCVGVTAPVGVELVGGHAPASKERAPVNWMLGGSLRRAQAVGIGMPPGGPLHCVVIVPTHAVGDAPHVHAVQSRASVAAP